MAIKKITVKNSNIRIDKYLSDELDITRSQVQKIIKSNLVKVNSEIVSANYKVKDKDKITIEQKEEKVIIKEKEEEIKNLPKLNIIEETDDFLVIEKPANLIVHGAEHIQEATLVDVLLDKYPKLAKIGEDPERPGIVHRLDKEVSGVMVIPRTQDSFDDIKKQFAKRTIKKEYTALVYGEVSKEGDEIRFPMQRSTQGFRMAALPEIVKGKKNKEGKTAISEFKVVKRFINYTLLSVKIKTGRTHQIRVHLSAYGHPIVGDSLYCTRKTKEKNEKIKLGRIFLTANKLEFTDLSGERRKYEVDLPDELEKFLKKVK